MLASMTARFETLSTVPVVRYTAASTPTSSASPSTPRPVPKFAEPRKFNGRADQVKLFLSEVEAGLYLQRNSLIEDQEKILWTSGYFADGNAKSWWLGIRDSPTMAHLLTSFASFKDAFISHFGDPHVSAAALDKLKSLRQTSSCATYVAAFREQLPYVELTEATKIDMFKAGLKPIIRNLMVTILDQPTDFDSYASIAIKFDHEQYRAQKELQVQRQTFAPAAPSSPAPSSQPWPYPAYAPAPTAVAPPPPAAPAPITSVTSDVVPMEIDALRQQRLPSQISPEELQRRIDLNLCRYCGGENHNADNCPNKSSTARLRDLQRRAQQNALRSTPAPKA